MTRVRIAGYTRISTGKQLSGYSLPEQKEAVRSYVKQVGGELVGIYQDVMSGGRSQRPGLNELKAKARTEGVDKIVFKSLSRFGRSIRDLLELFDFFERDCKVALVSLTENFDTGNPAGRLMRNILAAFYEFERDMTRERLEAGKAEKKAEEGKGAYTEGRPPYGWEAVDGKLVINKAEQTVRRRIKRLYKGGKNFSHIAQILNAEGIPPKTGKKWSDVAVRNIVGGGKQ